LIWLIQIGRRGSHPLEPTRVDESVSVKHALLSVTLGIQEIQSKERIIDRRGYLVYSEGEIGPLRLKNRIARSATVDAYRKKNTDRCGE
jgi:hypothetical protein